MDFSFWRRRDLGGFDLIVKTSTDMKTWEDTTVASEMIGYDPATDRLHVLYRFPVEPAKAARFVRLYATGP